MGNPAGVRVGECTLTFLRRLWVGGWAGLSSWAAGVVVGLVRSLLLGGCGRLQDGGRTRKNLTEAAARNPAHEQSCKLFRFSTDWRFEDLIRPRCSSFLAASLLFCAVSLRGRVATVLRIVSYRVRSRAVSSVSREQGVGRSSDGRRSCRYAQVETVLLLIYVDGIQALAFLELTKH